MVLADVPLFRRIVHRYFRPGEYYRFWDQRFPGFSRPSRDLIKDDVPPDLPYKVQEAFAAATLPRRQMIVKITGWPRLGFLKAIFPNAKFVHIHRDGRAVASSFLRVDWWWGWRGPGNWRLGPLDPSRAAAWEAYNHSYAILAGMGWEIMMDQFVNASSSLTEEEWLSIRYDRLCNDPVPTLQSILSFLGMRSSERVLEVGMKSVRSGPDDAYKRLLNGKQLQDLNEYLIPALQRHGYDV